MKRGAWSALVVPVAAIVGVACGGGTFGVAMSGDASAEGSGDDASASSSSSGASSSTSSGSSSGGGSGASGSSSGGGGSGGSASSSGSSSGGGSDGSSSSSSGASTSGGSGGGGGCDSACGTGRSCCDGACINPVNDPENCGACGTKCAPGTYCDGSCKPIPCLDGGACGSGKTCCGTSCCAAGQLCCQDEGPVGTLYPTCYTPTTSQPTCPAGCSPLCLSDRNVKRDIAPVDEQAVLERVASIPVSTWSYDSDDPAVRHLGPMAQDFHAAFGLGDTDRAYDPIDAHGVALAAIKALYERSRALDARIERLERENEELRSGNVCK